MAIYGIGAYYDADVSQAFIASSIVGVGWNSDEAPELREYIKSLKVGDIVYIKSAPPSSSDIHVKGIGIICDNTIRLADDTGGLVFTGRNVIWLSTEQFVIAKPVEKNNVRQNTIYEEFHPFVQNGILNHIAQREG